MNKRFYFGLNLPALSIWIAAAWMFFVPAKATHIVGAELFYECLNPNTHTYQVTLRILRDCATGQADFDDPISIFALPVSSPGNWNIFEVPQPSFTPRIVPEEWDDCVGRPYNICVEEAIYTRTITLQPIPGGYNLGWARCCRNQNITNIFNPLDAGVTFLAHVPGPEDAECNSMPRFDQKLPVFICRGETFTFDHSATDPDGDSLVYALTHPYDGLNVLGLGAGNATPGSPGPIVDASNPMGPPPYRNVPYNGPTYSAQNPFGQNSANIDPQTGVLQFTPPNLGVYVVAVSVFEYRNGVLLSENKTDLQIHVINCLQPEDPPRISHDLGSLNTNGDTIIINARESFCYRVTVTDTNLTDSLAASAISSIFGPNNPIPPSPTVTASGVNPLFLDVCWDPECEWIGQTVELVIMAWDINDCPNYNRVFDTVWVRIEPPPPSLPLVDYDISTTNFSGDTIIAQLDSTLCFTWWVVDTFQNGSDLVYDYTIEALSGNSGFQPTVIPNTTFQDSLPIQVCWTPGCDNVSETYRMILEGRDESVCPPNNFDLDTLYFRVLSIPNPPPVLSTDISGNILSGDTILVDVHDTACYNFVLNDTFPAVDLDFVLNLSAIDGFPAGGADPEITILSQTDSLVGRVCWTPSCDNVDRLFRLVMRGAQENRCNQFAEAYDTVYIRVRDVINPPPIIGHSFLPDYGLSGDTIRIATDSAACFRFFLRDTVYRSFLTIGAHAEFLSGDSSGNGISLEFTSLLDTLIEGEACITPGCDFLGDTLQIILTGRDTFDCSSANTVSDTIWLIAIEPQNQPPTIRHFYNGLPVVNDVIQAIPNGENYCYEILLEDPDSAYADLIAQGISDIFEEWWRYGNAADISVSGDNPLQINVCWNPSCYDTLQNFEIVVCGRDTSRCGLTPQVCDTVRFFVDGCDIKLGNVFTPNGDGINDEFVPFDMQGIEYYRLKIFDRWGKEVFVGNGQGWNGKLNGSGTDMPEGIYYYIFEYKFWSARGVPLDDQQVGHVTLMR